MYRLWIRDGDLLACIAETTTHDDAYRAAVDCGFCAWIIEEVY